MPSNRFQLPPSLKGRSFHLVGIKGTGMCALAELLVARGAHVTGSDVSERFYTDEILEELQIPVQPFAAESLDDNAEIIVRSAAYGDENPVLSAANDRDLPVLTYPQALGHLSTLFDSSAVAGVHGKTTTTALCGTLLKNLELPATVVVGSAVANFDNRSTWIGGQEFLVAETCEYRRHFLEFSPKRIILTSVEPDHQDYYPDYRSIHQAFMEFVTSLPPGGELIYCADDPGAAEVAVEAARLRPDILMTPYGETARGPWQIHFSAPEPGQNRFRVAGLEKEFVLNVPGRHLVLDTAAALALVSSCSGGHLDQEACFNALRSFRGSRRRSEIIGETQQILFMDDYAHHPTAVSTTLAGLRDFHPQRRLIVDFMPHTYSRTEALLEEFSECFADADILILHPIYASAREAYTGGIRGEDLYEKARARRPGKTTLFFSTLKEARDHLEQLLTEQDLMLTLGAGNNRPLGIELFEKFKLKDHRP